jgi:hypothetical protein
MSAGSQVFYRVQRCLTSESRGRHGTLKEATEPTSEEAELRHYDQIEERHRVPGEDDRLRQSYEHNPGRSDRVQKQLTYGEFRQPHSAREQHTLRLRGPSTTVDTATASALHKCIFCRAIAMFSGHRRSQSTLRWLSADLHLRLYSVIGQC